LLISDNYDPWKYLKHAITLQLKASPFMAGMEQKLIGFLALIAFDND
jgi:hypothetical protein